MTNAWPTTPLGEVVDRGGGVIRTGPFGSQLHSADYTQESNGVALVMPKDMVDGRVNRSSMARVRADKADGMVRHRCREGDIVLARRGEIGRCAYIRDEEAGILCGTGALRIGVQGTELDPRFLFYFLCSAAGRRELEGRAVGSTMANLSEGAVRAIQTPIPPAQAQRKIAAILSTYDDLIENNNRRIETLEEMAQRIYREWFVEFRYPGNGQISMVETERGAIPQGWRWA